MTGAIMDEPSAIAPNALYLADANTFLTRIMRGTVSLAYIDPPWGSSGLRSSSRSWAVNRRERLRYLGATLYLVRETIADDGSIILHLDPELGGYVRVLTERIFGSENMRAEIVWPDKRRNSASAQRVLLHYAKSNVTPHRRISRMLTPSEKRQRFSLRDDNGQYRLVSLTTPVGPRTAAPWRGIEPRAGYTWRYSNELLDDLDRSGKIDWSLGRPRLKQYADDAQIPIGTLWDDIADDATGRSTTVWARPRALTDRIIDLGSDEDQIVLDPFCGSGSLLVSAQAKSRKWLACDISAEMIEISSKRLFEAFNATSWAAGELETTLRPVGAPLSSIMSFIDAVLGWPAAKPETEAHRPRFTVGQIVDVEENRSVEFKEIRGNNPIDTIKNTVDEYVIAFLNAGIKGEILWGVRDDGRVIGVPLDVQARDAVRRAVDNKLRTIVPPIPPSIYKVEIFSVEAAPNDSRSLYVIRVTVERSRLTRYLFTTPGGTCYIKTDSGKQKIEGIAFQEELYHRFSLLRGDDAPGVPNQGSHR